MIAALLLMLADAPTRMTIERDYAIPEKGLAFGFRTVTFSNGVQIQTRYRVNCRTGDTLQTRGWRRRNITEDWEPVIQLANRKIDKDAAADLYAAWC